MLDFTIFLVTFTRCVTRIEIWLLSIWILNMWPVELWISFSAEWSAFLRTAPIFEIFKKIPRRRRCESSQRSTFDFSAPSWPWKTFLGGRRHLQIHCTTHMQDNATSAKRARRADGTAFSVRLAENTFHLDMLCHDALFRRVWKMLVCQNVLVAHSNCSDMNSPIDWGGGDTRHYHVHHQ